MEAVGEVMLSEVVVGGVYDEGVRGSTRRPADDGWSAR